MSGKKLYKQINENYNKMIAISLTVSTILHLILILILTLIPARIAKWDKVINITHPVNNTIKISKIFDKKELDKIIEPPPLPKKKLEDNFFKPIPKKNIKIIKDNKILETKNMDPIKENDADKKTINENIEKTSSVSEINDLKSLKDYVPPPKIVIDERNTIGSLKIGFNESEVIRGKSSWVGYAVGNALPSGASFRGGFKKLSDSKGVSYKGQASGIDSTQNFENIEKSDTTGSVNKNQEKIYEINELDKIPEPIENPIPVYPELAQRMKIEGKIWLKLLIGSDGKVKKIESIGSSSNVGFEESAIAASKQWKYTIPTINGHPVSIWFIVPFVFTLE